MVSHFRIQMMLKIRPLDNLLPATLQRDRLPCHGNNSPARNTFPLPHQMPDRTPRPPEQSATLPDRMNNTSQHRQRLCLCGRRIRPPVRRK